MQDLAFIKLEPTLQQAVNSMPSAFANIGYFDQIQLSPNETYSQITNTKSGIAFDGNYAVFVCNCAGEELLEITDSIQIIESQDNKGIQQIKFIILPIGVDFNKQLLLLKFVHTVSDYVWYSNLLTITDRNLYRTTRFDYKAYSQLDGIAYNKFEGYQSIRLACTFISPDFESKSSGYTSFEGIKVTSRLIKTEFQKYMFLNVDNYIYRRLNSLLIHPVIYVNDYRVTDKQTLAMKDPFSATNITTMDFKVAINYNEQLSIISNPAADFINTDWDNTDFYTN
jgi:hypothetical protein